MAATAIVDIGSSDGVPKLYCPLCNKALISLTGYAKHVKKHNPPGGFLCRFCEACFCSDEELKRHRDEVHTTISCRMCSADATTFNSEEDYREHIRLTHNGQDRQIYKCAKCGAEYKTRAPYKRHLETDCGTLKPHNCDECDMTFMTKYSLKQHKEMHSGERKFCCSYCGKNFMQKGRLVEHERSHTGEKPYKCDVCGKSFAHRESIVTHSSIHTGVRLVECKCCQSRFSCHSNLIKHRRARPDTCGQQIYDPPKHRVRTHTSRIPATLNPTTEIKVSGLNKTIKPGDMEQVKRVEATRRANSEQEASMAAKQVTPSRGRSARRPVGRPPKKQAPKSETEEEEEEEFISTSSNDSSRVETATEKRTKSRRSPRHAKAPMSELTSTKNKAKAASRWHSSDNDDGDDDSPGLDPHDTDEETDEDIKNLQRQLGIKTEKDGEESEDEMEFIVERDDESINERPAEAGNIKSEQYSIFSEKDQLIERLLNDSDNSMQHDNSKLRHGQLHETEVILIKDENIDLTAEAPAIPAIDALALQDGKSDASLLSCQIRLDDVRRQYPKLKKDGSVRLRRSKRKLRSSMSPPATRKSRESASMGVAKLNSKELRIRLKSREETAWECPHCIKIYYMRKPFEKHLRESHKCADEEIRELFNQFGMSQVQSDEVYKCHICDKIYLLEKRLRAHIKLHGPDGKLVHKCPCYCFVYFGSRDEAIAHAQTEHRKLLWCEICEKYMTCHDSYKNHMRNFHEKIAQKPTAQRNLVCDKCGKKFSARTPLNDHVRSDCGRKPIYACHICGKHLTTAGILKTHMSLHKDETPFQCEHCGKTFKVKAQYKTHLKVRHTDDKPFKCHLCPKAYPYRESLLTHMTVHTGMKRFLCNGCGKRFTCISNLQAHRKVHADSCGQMPLNAKATQYMGVQKGNLLLGAKPEAGLDYLETNTLIAKEVLQTDLPMAQELNYPSEPTAPMATVALNHLQHIPQICTAQPQQQEYTANSNNTQAAPQAVSISYEHN